jgi:hypothetical protein
VLPARSVTAVDVRYKPGSRRVVRVPPPVDMLPRTRPPSTRPGRLLAATGIAASIGAAVGVVVWEPWHGPVILSLSTGHGIDAGNVAAVPFVALAIAIGRRASPGTLGRHGGHARTVGRRRGAWPAAAGMILIGCVVDAVFAPSITLFGPTLLAVWFALSAEDGREAVVGWLVTCALTLVTAASLTDLAGIESRMQRDDGGLARSAALGVTLVAIGLVMLRRDPPSRRKRAAASPAR